MVKCTTECPVRKIARYAAEHRGFVNLKSAEVSLGTNLAPCGREISVDISIGSRPNISHYANSGSLMAGDYAFAVPQLGSAIVLEFSYDYAVEKNLLTSGSSESPPISGNWIACPAERVAVNYSEDVQGKQGSLLIRDPSDIVENSILLSDAMFG